jgi:hypothetical protein
MSSSTRKLICNNRKKQVFDSQLSMLERGEAVIKNSLLAAARSRELRSNRRSQPTQETDRVAAVKDSLPTFFSQRK